MRHHGLSQADHAFRSAFEACAVAPADFNHEAHLRLAYIYLVECCSQDAAVNAMRQSLLNFLEHHGVPRAKFHETLTRAWVLAVAHFMTRASSASADEFIQQSDRLGDSKVMLTHYTPELLFSPAARASYIKPNIAPIPLHA